MIYIRRNLFGHRRGLVKYTIKEIKRFLRGLEENKYRRRYAIDAKRIHYFANNGVNATLPPSLSRKNESAAYKRDKFLAKEFIKHIKEIEKVKRKNLRQESLLKEIVRELIKEEIVKVNESTNINFSGGANLNVLKKFGTFTKGGKLYTLTGTNQPMLVKKKGNNIESLAITSGLRVSKFDDRAWEKQLYKLAKGLKKKVDDEYGDYDIG